MNKDQLIIPKLAHQQLSYSGIDSPEHCCDPELFHTWPHTIDYKYNSRGFRDQEWPEDLTSPVWCLGDSFTVGLGSRFEHTWPQIVSQHTQHRVITVSMDGASNDWIARQACAVYDLARPANIVVMWSYLHRRENLDLGPTDLDRRLHYIKSTVEQDYDNFVSCRKLIRTHCKQSNIVELVIPGFAGHFTDLDWKKIRDQSWPSALPGTLTEFSQLPQAIVQEIRTVHDLDVDHLLEHYTIQQRRPDTLADVILVPYLDLARDGHHFDRLTAEWVAAQVQNLLNL
jgi:hypothetical protein